MQLWEGSWGGQVCRAGRSFWGWARDSPKTSRLSLHHPNPSLALDGELVVWEEEEEAQEDGGRRRLQLLDPGDDFGCGAWGVELPQRLRELHSHWISR